ncbi:MAG: hypothetical protein M3R36_04180 [Bacteroidota bacterium]|nr:hypothetical protein [Bacteroidota bacterium]
MFIIINSREIIFTASPVIKSPGLDKAINNDPILKNLKKSYDKINKDHRKNFTKDNISNINRYNNPSEDKLILKAKENIMRAQVTSNEAKDENRFEDMKLLLNYGINENQIDNINLSQPIEFSLEQNYPNPFNPTTVIHYSLSENGFIILKVFDLLGKEIVTLINQNQIAGKIFCRFQRKQFIQRNLFL